MPRAPARLFNLQAFPVLSFPRIPQRTILTAHSVDTSTTITLGGGACRRTSVTRESRGRRRGFGEVGWFVYNTNCSWERGSRSGPKCKDQTCGCLARGTTQNERRGAFFFLFSGLLCLYSDTFLIALSCQSRFYGVCVSVFIGIMIVSAVVCRCCEYTRYGNTVARYRES